MNISQKLTIQLIRNAIFGTPVKEELLSQVDEKLINQIYDISFNIDMSYIVASALYDNGLFSAKVKSAFFNEQLASIYRYEKIKFELDSVSELFERESIDFVPLKGSVIRNYYPKPEMRTSCDIDILIHKYDLDKARRLLEQKLNYSYNAKCGHDISFWSPSDVEIELHHTLFEFDSAEKEQLDKVWDYAYCTDKDKHRHEMDKAFLMFYHIVHMIKHIKSGGCGIRPFLDLKILEDRLDYDREKLNSLLSESGLITVADKLFDIADVWFGTKQEDELSDLMAEYVFGAGAYGSAENQVARIQNKKGSRIKSIFSRIFISSRELGNMYPSVRKYPWLTPVFEVIRWMRIVFKDKAKIQLAKLRHNVKITEEKKNNVAKLFNELNIR